MNAVPTSARRELFQKLRALVEHACKVAHVKRILLAGGFVTAKPDPNDLDVLILLDPCCVGVELRPFEYNSVDARAARRLFKADVFTAIEGSVAAEIKALPAQSRLGAGGNCGDSTMNVDETRLRASLESMMLFLDAIEDIRSTVLPKDPARFAAMSQGYLDQLGALRKDILECLSPADAKAITAGIVAPSASNVPWGA